MERCEELRTLRALGLCAKARKLIFGTPMVCDAMKAGKPVFGVLCAGDNSENTVKRLSDRCRFYGVSLTVLKSDGEVLAGAVGKTGRLAAVAVTDENLYRLVSGTLE